MNNICKKLGNTIKEARKAKQYSTNDLASKLNVSIGLINNIENARNDVFKINLLIKLASELDIPIEKIFRPDLIKVKDTSIKNSNRVKLSFDITSYHSKNHDLVIEYLKRINSLYLETIDLNYENETYVNNTSNYILDSLELVKKYMLKF